MSKPCIICGAPTPFKRHAYCGDECSRVGKGRIRARCDLRKAKRSGVAGKIPVTFPPGSIRPTTRADCADGRAVHYGDFISDAAVALVEQVQKPPGSAWYTVR